MFSLSLFVYFIFLLLISLEKNHGLSLTNLRRMPQPNYLHQTVENQRGYSSKMKETCSERAGRQD